MSQTTIPFQPATVVDDDTAPALEESGRSTRVLVALAAVGALAVLAAVAYFLVFAGGSEDAAPDAAAPAPQSVVQPPAAPSTAPNPPKVQITARNFGTDPFKPLLVEAAPVTDTAATSTTTSTDTAATTDTSTTGGATTDTSGSSTPTSSTSHRFAVVDVAADNKTVDVRLDGKTYKSLHAGDVFAENFKVRFIGGSTNSFQIGDEVFNVSGSKAVMISG